MKNFLVYALAVCLALSPSVAFADGPAKVQSGITTSFGARVDQNTTPTDGQVLTYVAASGAWKAAAASAAPSGAAGGDLGSTYPNPTVTGLTHVASQAIWATGGSYDVSTPEIKGPSDAEMVVSAGAGRGLTLQTLASSGSPAGTVSLNPGLTTGAQGGTTNIYGGHVGSGTGQGGVLRLGAGSSGGSNQDAQGAQIGPGIGTGTGHDGGISFVVYPISASSSTSNAANVQTALLLKGVQNDLSGTRNLATFSGTFANGGSASTGTGRLLYASGALNFTGGSPADSFSLIQGDLTETSDPTGSLYLLLLRAGASGNTAMFSVSNAGVVSLAQGSTTAPALTFSAFPTCGLYNSGGFLGMKGTDAAASSGLGGGSSNVVGGTGDGAGAGGSARLTGGTPGSTGTGGQAQVAGGAGIAAGGGATICNGGAGVGTDKTSGGLTLGTGASTGAAAPNTINLQGAPAVSAGASGSGTNSQVTLLSLKAVQNNLTGTNNLSTLSATFTNGGSASSSTLNRLDYGQMTLNYTGGTKTDAITMLGRDLVETGDPSGTILLMELRAGASGTTSEFKVDNVGNGTFAATCVANNYTVATGGSYHWTSKSYINSPADSQVQFLNNAATGFSTFFLGLKTPTGSDTAGQATLIAAGPGTGLGTGSTLGFQVSPILATGSTVQTLGTVFSLAGAQNNLSGTNNVATFSATFADGGTTSSGTERLLYAQLTANQTAASRTANVTVFGVDWVETSNPSGTLNLMDLRAGAAGTTSYFSVDHVGNTTAGGVLSGSSLNSSGAGTIGWTSKTKFTCATDSQVQLANLAGTGFQGLQLGNTTPTYPGSAPTHAQTATIGCSEELLTLSTSGTTTDTSANLLPANAIILSVTVRVTTTITTATDWSVGDPTTSTRFSSANSTLTSGTTSVGMNQLNGNVTTTAAGPTQAAAAKVRITTTGTPGAGAVRITTHYIILSAATS